MITIGQKQTIQSWWIFHRLDSVTNATPNHIYDWIDEANEDLEQTDTFLASQYEEYIQQL